MRKPTNNRTFRTLLWVAGVAVSLLLGIVIWTAHAIPDIRCDVREHATKIDGLDQDREEITEKLEELDRTLDQHSRALDRIQDRLGIDRPRESSP